MLIIESNGGVNILTVWFLVNYGKEIQMKWQLDAAIALADYVDIPI